MTILLSHQLFAQDVTDPKFQQYEHENPGCPINSNCSEEMGKLISKWVKTLEKPSKNKTQSLNKFRKEYGTPIQILAKQEVYNKADPILWNSRCKLHNPKNPKNTIYQGYVFLKNKLELENATFSPVYLYEGKKKIKYHIPYGDQVTFIQNDKLIVLKDFEDNYYKIAISPDLSYQITDANSSLVNKSLAKKIKDIECPEEIEYDEDYFKSSYCQKVLDIDTNQLRTIQLTWACP